VNQGTRIFVAGHQGLVGSALMRVFSAASFENLITRTRHELDLREQSQVRDFFRSERPEIVIMAAAKVGGIYANSAYPADFIYDNLIVQCNVIHSAFEAGCASIVFLGSSCIYPREALQPMKEEYLLSGKLEPTNEPYAIAKIAGAKMCEAYTKQYDISTLSLMPTNMYGPFDNFDLQNSHVLPAMIRRFHEAKLQGHPEVLLWGTGTARREFLFVDDFAQATLFLLQKGIAGILNVGFGKDVTILELAQTVSRIVGYEGIIRFDPSMPDGMPRKLLDVTRLNRLGWKPHTTLEEGLTKTYAWYLNEAGAAR
jgi:GDP-L-fucose synthase